MKSLRISNHVKLAREHDKKIHAQYKNMIYEEDYLHVLKFCAQILRHHGLQVPLEQLSEDPVILADIIRVERFVI